MNLSRAQKWLTVGFGISLAALLGTALLAAQAILNRNHPFGDAGAQTSFNEIFLALSEAEVSHQTYLKTGEQKAFTFYKSRIEIVDRYLRELETVYLSSTDLEIDSEPLDAKAMNDLKLEIGNSLQLLNDEVRLKQTGKLAPPTQLDFARQRSETRLRAQTALQRLFEKHQADSRWAIADLILGINNDLWQTGVVAGVGSLSLCALYVGLMRSLNRQQKRTAMLRDENEVLRDRLALQAADLQTTQAELSDEFHRRQALESNYREIEQAKELTDLKLNFFSLASHELRTPLSAILVSAQLLDNPNAVQSEEKRSRNLKRIQSSAKTMTNLLADILLLTRAEAGKLEFAPREISLTPFCRRLVEEIKFNTQAQQSIIVQTRGDGEGVCLDESLLRAMLMSLLTNAIKYSPPESEIQLIVIAGKDSTCFQIIDRGIGILDSDRQRLFESFHRGQNVASVTGTGLGLAVVKKCLELHGGTIEVNSQIGVGTTFTLNIPRTSPLNPDARETERV